MGVNPFDVSLPDFSSFARYRSQLDGGRLIEPFCCGLRQVEVGTKTPA